MTTDEAWRAQVDLELQAGRERMDAIERRLRENTEATDRLIDSTRDLVAAFAAASGAFRVLEWIGRAAKPLLWLAAAASAVTVVTAKVRATMGW